MVKRLKLESRRSEPPEGNGLEEDRRLTDGQGVPDGADHGEQQHRVQVLEKGPVRHKIS